MYPNTGILNIGSLEVNDYLNIKYSAINGNYYGEISMILFDTPKILTTTSYSDPVLPEGPSMEESSPEEQKIL